MTVFNADQFRTFVINAGPRPASSAWRMASKQPGWVSRIAAIAFLLIIGLPILLLVGLAILAAVVVFFVLALVNLVMNIVGGWFRGMGPRRDGRENVKVIRRDP